MDKIIKDRIDAIRQDLSADQYTKTEIGVLPSDWGVASLSDFAEKVTQTAGTGSYETVSISAGIGFVNQAKKFGKELSGKQYEKYTVLHKGDFSYNTYSGYGRLKCLRCGEVYTDELPEEENVKMLITDNVRRKYFPNE